MMRTFGAIPGEAKPYGFLGKDAQGSVYTVVNPGQNISTVDLPDADSPEKAIIYSDDGFKVKLSGKQLTIGPEQLVVLGTGEYCKPDYNLGTDPGIIIPDTIEILKTEFSKTGLNSIQGTINHIPHDYHIRIIFQQFNSGGVPMRTWTSKNFGQIFHITAKQGEKMVPVFIDYDKVIWSGLSWAVGEIKSTDLNDNEPLEITCQSEETTSLEIRAEVYGVKYLN